MNEIAARQLAELVLDMGMVSQKGLSARRLAREVLGITDAGHVTGTVLIITNGTARVVPVDEPVFLIRGQDAVGGEAVRAWATLAEAAGAAPEIIETARQHAALMDRWPKKKTPDMKRPEEFIPPPLARPGELLFENRVPEAAARQLAIVLAWLTETALATLEGLKGRKSTSQYELRRQSQICDDAVRHCRELGVTPRGLSGAPCGRLEERLKDGAA